MIAALYVDPRGPYFGRDDVDPWDEKRDARLYRGPWPVVAHPPCARWSRLARQVEVMHGRKVGDDGGTFAAALTAVRTWGGVLEHPAHSKAWAAYHLPKPTIGWTRCLFDDGWVCAVTQATYGHLATKPTWLYYVGDAAPFELDWSHTEGTHCLASPSAGRGGSTLPEIRRSLRHLTPLPFLEVLVSLAESSRSPVTGGKARSERPGRGTDPRQAA